MERTVPQEQFWKLLALYIFFCPVALGFYCSLCNQKICEEYQFEELLYVRLCGVITHLNASISCQRMKITRPVFYPFRRDGRLSQDALEDPFHQPALQAVVGTIPVPH